MNIRPEFDTSNIQTPKLCLIACGVSNQAASCAVANTCTNLGFPYMIAQYVRTYEYVRTYVRTGLSAKENQAGEFSVFDLEQICSPAICMPLTAVLTSGLITPIY